MSYSAKQSLTRTDGTRCRFTAVDFFHQQPADRTHRQAIRIKSNEPVAVAGYVKIDAKRTGHASSVEWKRWKSTAGVSRAPSL